MLDENIKQQLKEVFTALENPVELIFDSSDHPKQEELTGMLSDIQEASEMIRAEASGIESPYPRFRIRLKGEENGIVFSGIPGGHEFTSLILAILNSDSKGKFPDEMIVRRIRNLKGPVKLRTYVSLSCENCPDVVQALNLMTVLNPGLEHEMADGEYFQDEISKLNIQGVPSVVSDGKLIHSGKISFADLLSKLESEIGTESDLMSEPVELGLFDVVVVGGGPAGAASAIYTARKGLKTAVIADRIGGQMQETKGIENFLSVPYTEGPQLSAKLAEHMSQYDIQVFEHRRVASVEKGDIKLLKLSSGESLQAKSLIVATGAKWRELGIPGEKEYIGRGVAFCPHCDGPYYKGKKVAVVGGGNSGVEAAIDLAGIVESVVLIEFMPELKADQVLVKKLESLPNVSVIKNAKTREVVGDGNKVTALEYENRTDGKVTQLKLDGIFVQIGLTPNSAFMKDAVEMNRFGEILVDAKCKTSEKGIYAAGDVTNVPYKQIVIAMGEGAKAGLSAFEGLMIA